MGPMEMAMRVTVMGMAMGMGMGMGMEGVVGGRGDVVVVVPAQHLTVHADKPRPKRTLPKSFEKPGSWLPTPLPLPIQAPMAMPMPVVP